MQIQTLSFIPSYIHNKSEKEDYSTFRKQFSAVLYGLQVHLLQIQINFFISFILSILCLTLSEDMSIKSS